MSDAREEARRIAKLHRHGGTFRELENSLLAYGRAEWKRGMEQALFAVHNWAQAGTAIRALIDEEERSDE